MQQHTILYFTGIVVFYLLILHWISCLFSNYVLRTKQNRYKSSNPSYSFFTNALTQQQKDKKRRHDSDSFIGATTYMPLPEYANNSSPTTNHTVDVPINTPYQCSNFCGPNSTCSITGEQCTSDIDCQGCQPPLPSPSSAISANNIEGIRGDNDSGKLTSGMTPQYSTLTQPFGTTSAAYLEGTTTLSTTPPVMPYLGKDTWITSFNEGTDLFNQKLKGEYERDPEKYTKYASQVVHPTTKSVTGLFDVTGPMAANS